MLTWEQYRRRRRINIKKWLTVNNINNYEKLVNVCLLRGVQPPPPEETLHFFEDSGVVAPEPVSEKVSPPPPEEVIEPEEDHPHEDPADLGVYDINDEGFLIVKKEGIRTGLKRK